MKHWNVLLALTATAATAAPAGAPALPAQPPATGGIQGLSLSLTPPEQAAPAQALPNLTYVPAPVPSRSPTVGKALEEWRRNGYMVLVPQSGRRLEVRSGFTLRPAPPAGDRSLLVYRDADRLTFKKEHPLLTPDVPVIVAPLQEGSPAIVITQPAAPKR